MQPTNPALVPPNWRWQKLRSCPFHLSGCRLGGLILLLLVLGVLPARSATRTWTGSANGWFTNAANWQGNVAPASNDAVEFPDSAARKNITNTLASLSLDSITFSGSNFVLRGQGDVNLFVNKGIYSHAPGTNLIEHRMMFNGGIVTSNSVPGSRLHLKSHLAGGSTGNLITIFGGHTFQGDGDTFLDSFRSFDDPSQTLVKEGLGTLYFAGTAAGHNGPFNINAGRLQMEGAVLNASYVNVADRATVAGQATVDNLYVSPGAAVEPGARGGLDIANEITFAPGSRLGVGFTQSISPEASRIDLSGQLSSSHHVVGLSLFTTEELTGFNGQDFRIIQDMTATLDAIPRIFVGVPEDGYVGGVGQIFQVSYRAGVGNNDVVITHQTNTPAAAGTRTWAGLSGGDGNWRTAGNWTGGAAPTNAYHLVFPAGAGGRSMTNDFTGAPVFGELRFGAPNYVLRGQPFSLFGGLIVSNNAAARFRARVEIVADQTFRNDDTLVFFEGLHVWDRALTLTGAGQTEIAGSLQSGSSGAVIKNGTGTLLLSGENHFRGELILNRGLTICDATLPDAAGGTRCSLGAEGELQLTGGRLPGLRGAGGMLRLDGPAVSTGSVKLTNTIVRWDLSASPGLTVDGALVLAGAVLQLTNSAATLPAQTTFTNMLLTGGSPIVGTYAGLPENAIISYGSNQFFVRYTGGGGNALVLELIPPVVTYTWDGGGADGYWLNRNNWAGQQPIGINANLVFPDGAARSVSTNGVTPGFTLYNRIELRGAGYVLRGLPLTLADGILHKPSPGTGTNTISFDLALLGALSVQNDSGFLRLNGAVELADFDMNLTSFGDTRLAGPLRGLGRVIKTGPGLLEISSTNDPGDFAGEIVASGGPLQISGSFRSGTTRVQAGATLSGTGTAQSVTVEVGGRVTPGVNGIGALTVRGLSFENGAVLGLSLYPANSSSSNRLLAGPGVLDLSQATLALSLAHVPQPGEHHVLVEAMNLGLIAGTFSGLPEDALIPANGAYYRISYINGPVELDYFDATPSANVRIWQGGAPAPLWSDQANWAGGMPPGVGESVLFPASAAARMTTNEIVRTYSQLRFAAPNYEVWAPQMGLLSGIVVSNNAGARLHTPIVAVSQLAFDVAGFLRLYGPLMLAERSLTVTGAGETRLDGRVSGSAAVFMNGPGSLRLAEASLGEFAATAGVGEWNSLTASGPLPLLTSGDIQLASSVTLRAPFGADNTAARAPLQAGGRFQPNDATLQLEINYGAAVGDVLVLATAAQPISGTFSGLREGATLRAGGVTWQISYAANGGKRVTLTAQTAAPAAPVITGITRLGNGNIRVDGLGATNVPIALEVSSDLVDWVFLAGRPMADGTFQYVELTTPVVGPRFYRARLQ